jgi:uncharacterized protein (TIGR00369 family)
MTINTHYAINQELCGHPLHIEEGKSQIELITTRQMAADDSGLVHGGFIFGLADYAAMLAVNHPNVVLGAAETKFLKPVRVGEVVKAQAKIESTSGKKQTVSVRVDRSHEKVFEGKFTCFILDRHILAPK